MLEVTASLSVVRTCLLSQRFSAVGFPEDTRRMFANAVVVCFLSLLRVHAGIFKASTKAQRVRQLGPDHTQPRIIISIESLAHFPSASAPDLVPRLAYFLQPCRGISVHLQQGTAIYSTPFMDVIMVVVLPKQLLYMDIVPRS